MKIMAGFFLSAYPAPMHYWVGVAILVFIGALVGFHRLEAFFTIVPGLVILAFAINAGRTKK